MTNFKAAVVLRSDGLAELDLVERLAAGDQDAITSFYVEYFPRLGRFAHQKMHSETNMVNEVVHTVLSKAIYRFETYRNEASLFSWLCAICRNGISEYFRRIARDRRHITSSDVDPDVRLNVGSLAGPASDEPEYYFLRLQLNRRIRRTIDRLPMHYGRALKWKHLDGLTVAEIAAQLDVSRSAAESLLSRARAAFRHDYSHHT